MRSLTCVTISEACFRTKARQALTTVHKWPLLSESRRGIFNARNDFSACCVREGETGIKVLHKCLRLSKSRRGIFNARNDFSACCVREGETGIDKTAQVAPSYQKVDVGSLTPVTILVRAVYAKMRQALTRLHKWPLLIKK